MMKATKKSDFDLDSIEFSLAFAIFIFAAIGPVMIAFMGGSFLLIHLPIFIVGLLGVFVNLFAKGLDAAFRVLSNIFGCHYNDFKTGLILAGGILYGAIFCAFITTVIDLILLLQWLIQ